MVEQKNNNIVFYLGVSFILFIILLSGLFAFTGAFVAWGIIPSVLVIMTYLIFLLAYTNLVISAKKDGMSDETKFSLAIICKETLDSTTLEQAQKNAKAWIDANKLPIEKVKVIKNEHGTFYGGQQ